MAGFRHFMLIFCLFCAHSFQKDAKSFENWKPIDSYLILKILNQFQTIFPYENTKLASIIANSNEIYSWRKLLPIGIKTYSWRQLLPIGMKTNIKFNFFTIWPLKNIIWTFGQNYYFSPFLLFWPRLKNWKNTSRSQFLNVRGGTFSPEFRRRFWTISVPF